MKIFFICVAFLLSLFSTVCFAVNSSSCINYTGGKCYYNGTIARSYAMLNAFNVENPNNNVGGTFPYYTGDAANCTNFVSQSLLAGLIGTTNKVDIWNKRNNFITDKTGGNTYYRWYFVSDSDRGPAFTGAHKLYEYAVYNKPTYKGMHFTKVTDTKGSSQVLDFMQVQVGDIIFLDFQGDNIMDHTMIVTHIDPAITNNYGRIKVTYQSNENRNKALSTIYSDSLNLGYYYISSYVFRPTFYSDTGL